MAPPERIRLIQNPGCENERARFEKIDDERPKNTITMSANRSQNYPRRGITLQAQRSTSHITEQRDATRQ